MKKSQTDDVKTRYTLASSTWDEKELQAIQEVIKSDIFTMGKKVAGFEKDFARFVGSKYAVMTSSGSTANLIATAALFYTKTPRLKRGDEVIVPAVSWSTTYYPLYQYGLKLKFVDIDLETLNYDLEALKTAITDSTKMIMCVNLLGNPNDFDAIKAMISNRDIILLEDNCESMGAEYKGKQAGTFGVMGTFSTFYSHHMATMEGGFVVTDDEELYHILLCLRAHGWTRNLPKDNLVAKKSDDWFSESFRFVLPGYNVRPVEMSGAIGIEQLKKLPDFLKHRRENAKLFCSYFANHPDFIIQKEIGSSSWFGFSLIIRPDSKIQRNEIIQKLEKNNIEYRPIATGDFTQNEVIKYFDYTIHKELKNAKYLQEKGFFVGNHQVDISDSIKLFAKVIGGGGGHNLVAFSSIKDFNATSIIFTIYLASSIKNNTSHLKLNPSQISCLQNLAYTTKAA
ncbi:DegT/DnrJ/EryC1/StrS family aminotransferase [Helicobacter winghamensis]|uniref:DegT/DnrJ/EryC1/StrS family aminotransferase n=1 Tax=Helicobacter winghamensis TaxID=157268 RepID=UPI000C6D7726|nr:DegT/DnrJ/EryC1/StrS family aminotransferase [Helicobacter winghamensis]